MMSLSNVNIKAMDDQKLSEQAGLKIKVSQVMFASAEKIYLS